MTREQAEHILTAFLIMPSGGEAQNALREVIIDAMCAPGMIITPPHPLIPATNKPVNPTCNTKVVE